MIDVIAEIKAGERARRKLSRRLSAMAPRVNPPRWYVASCGEAAIDRTGCMVEVEFFADPLAYGRACQRIEREHSRGNLDSYTMGEIRE